MMRTRLDTIPVKQLVERFIEICIAQDEALLDDDLRKFNRLFDQMQSVLNELKKRDGDQRRALLSLYDHPNMQVRLKAAKATLAIAPESALQALREIKESKHYPQAGEAGMSLWNLERGVYKPT